MTLSAGMFARPLQFGGVTSQSSAPKSLFASDRLAKVRTIWEAARNSKFKVPELLAAEARSLTAFDFSALMLTVEEHGSFWFESERFFVFCHSNGNVRSVWLGGSEVYNSIWNNC